MAGPSLPDSTIQAAVNDLKSIALPIVLESVFYGIFILVYSFAALSLYGQKGWIHRAMLGVTTLMFVAGTTHWSLELWSFLQVLHDANDYHLWPNYLSRSTALSYSLGTNFFFSDAIVLWRACVLWRGNRCVYAVSALLLCATFTFELVDVTLATEAIPRTNITFLIPIILYNDYGTVCVVSSLLANVWATILVGIKAWKYRRGIERDLRDSSSSSIAQKIMTLLLECGALYCLIWVLFIVAFVSDKGALVLGGPEDVPDQVSDHIVTQLTGIYPTIIVVLVRFRRTYNEQTFNPSTMSTIGGYNVPSRSNHITLPRNRMEIHQRDAIDDNSMDFQESGDLPSAAPKVPRAGTPDDARITPGSDLP